MCMCMWRLLLLLAAAAEDTRCTRVTAVHATYKITWTTVTRSCTRPRAHGRGPPLPASATQAMWSIAITAATVFTSAAAAPHTPSCQAAHRWQAVSFSPPTGMHTHIYNIHTCVCTRTCTEVPKRGSSDFAGRCARRLASKTAEVAGPRLLTEVQNNVVY